MRLQLSPRTAARIAALACICLAACATLAPKPEPIPHPLPPVVQTGGDLTPGFNDKEPDTCKSAALQGLIGQPSGMSRTVSFHGPVRIIEPGTVYDQEDYRSDRANLFVDGEGVILRVACG